jgi:DNA-binding MarR family transcriptional regulator
MASRTTGTSRDAQRPTKPAPASRTTRTPTPPSRQAAAATKTPPTKRAALAKEDAAPTRPTPTRAPKARVAREPVRAKPAMPLQVDPSAPAVDGEPLLRAEQCIALLQRRLIKPMSRGGPRGDLTLTQYHALSFLAARGQASVSELKDILGVAQSTTSVLVDKLARLGLVEKQRDGRDHRLACVVPLPKGLRMVQRYRKNAERNLLALAGVLGDDAVREVFVALERALVATAPLEDPRVLRAIDVDDGVDGDDDSLDLEDDAALEAAE